MALLTPEDVLLFEPDADQGQVKELVDGISSRVRISIPTLTKEDVLSDDQKSSIKDILRRVVIRTLNAGDGNTVTEAAPGGWSKTVQAPDRKGLIYDSEWAELRQIAGDVAQAEESKAFAFLSNADEKRHVVACDYYFGWPCSCPPPGPVVVKPMFFPDGV